MRKYWELCKSSMKMSTAYHAWFWAGTAATLMRLVIIYCFWTAVFANRTEMGAMTLGTMITYQVLALLLSNYSGGGAGNELARMIKDGGVAVELMRPYDLLTKVVSLEVGGKIVATFQSTLPMLVIGFAFMGVEAPASVTAGVLFVISTVFGVLLATLFDQIIGVASFWTVNVFGLGMLKNAVYLFFTGTLVPISLFPGWLQAISNWMPFQAMVYLPVSIYTGTKAGAEAWQALGLQVVWLAVIFSLLRGFWAVARRKITIFGG